jgi:hypothetical protein
MNIKQALILAKDQKTDDELKAIMATLPSPRTHGFYKSLSEKWDHVWPCCTLPDAIWIDKGLTGFDHENKWIVEGFHTPNTARCRPLSTDPFGSYEQHKDDLKNQWWGATVKLILYQIPDGYRVYAINYGEIEDEFDGAEAAWRESLLEHLDYSVDAEALFGTAEPV